MRNSTKEVHTDSAKNYLALIGDLVDSKKIADRRTFQEQLSRTLEGVSARGEGILSPLTITIGDEVQALYATPDRLWADMLELQIAVFPQRFRFAVGVGALSTEVNRERAIGMDGPAFHAAREAIERLKTDGGMWRVAGGEKTDWEFENAVLAYVGHHMEDWARNRWVVLFDRMQGMPVRKTAAELGISREAVHKNIHAGALDEIVKLLHSMDQILNRTLDGA